MSGVKDDVLPEWFLKNLPEVGPCSVLGFDEDEGIFWVLNREDNSLSHFDTVREAVESKNNLSIDQSVADNFKVIHNCVINDDDVAVVSNKGLKFELLKDEWRKWSVAADKVASGEHSWQDAYTFIELCPLFWHNPKGNRTLDWNTRSGNENIYHFLNKDKIVMSLSFNMDCAENEGYVEVEASSIDEAYGILAEELLKHINVKDCTICS